MQQMGATPVDPTPTATKKSYSLQELQSLGAAPVEATAPVAPAQSDGIIKSIAKDAFKTLLVKPAARATEALGRTGLFGENIKRGYETMADEGTPQRILGVDIEQQKGFGSGGEKQIVGDALKSASWMFPFGRAAKAASVPLSKVMSPAASKLGGYVASGATGGYLADVGYDLEEGKSFSEALKPGLGTAIGAGIPLAGPVTRGAGRLAGEALGVSTGTGYGAIREGLAASRAGGEVSEAYKASLRGNINPEQIVDEARGALGTIIQNRTKAYRSQLENLKTSTKEFNIAPVIERFNKKLEEFNVVFDEKGIPDFTRSPGLGRYEDDLRKMSNVLSTWGTKQGDNTVVGIDTLKQVLDDFRIGSRDSQKFDSFVTDLRNEAKKVIKNEPGYDKLVKGYEESTGLIKEIQRGLSLGDKAQTDTAFRKLTGTLRTNNEFRKQLIDELNDVTGGLLTPKIAGQQLSEIAPRGLIRVLGGGAAGIGALSGVGIVPMLKMALFTSPRLVGEVLRVLGFTQSQIMKVLEAIVPKGLRFPGDVLYENVMGTKPKGTPQRASSLSKVSSEKIANAIQPPAKSSSNSLGKEIPGSAKMPTANAIINKDVKSIPKSIPQVKQKSIPSVTEKRTAQFERAVASFDGDAGKFFREQKDIAIANGAKSDWSKFVQKFNDIKETITPRNFYRGSKQETGIPTAFSRNEAVFVTTKKKDATAYAGGRGGVVTGTEYPYSPLIGKAYAHDVFKEIGKMNPALKNTQKYKDAAAAMDFANTDALALQELTATMPKELAQAIRNMGYDGIKTRGGEYVLVPPIENYSQKMAQFERAKDLSRADQLIEEKAYRKIIKQEAKLLEDYKKIPETKGGKIINTDIFRRLFKDEGYAGYNAASVQEPSSYLSKKAFTQALKENPGDVVVFTAGGSGTGKSSAIKGISDVSSEMDGASVVLDSNLSSYKSAIKKLNEALDAKKKVVIDFVYRDPYDAFEKGVVKRMLTNKEEGGRLVPSHVVAGNHIDSLVVAKQLEDEGFAVRFIDNSRGPGNQQVTSFQEISKKANYPTVEKLTEEFNNIAKKLYEEGTISKEQYEGYIRKD